MPLLIALPTPWECQVKATFQRNVLLWRGWPGPFPKVQDHHFSGRRGYEREKEIPRPRPVNGWELFLSLFFFFSNSEILTGITSQDSKCFLSCYNPLKFFFSVPPVILSVFLTHFLRSLVPLLHSASLTQGQGKRLEGFQVYDPL